VSGRACCGATVTQLPFVQAGALSLVSEGCSPANSAADPGEAVTMSFTLQNIGAASTTNLVATLLVTNGVTAPGAPQTYGALASGGGGGRPFIYLHPGRSCGEVVLRRFSCRMERLILVP